MLKEPRQDHVRYLASTQAGQAALIGWGPTEVRDLLLPAAAGRPLGAQHTVSLYSLVRMGARTGLFARVVEAGFHQRAIGLVHAGPVDAAAIDSQVLAIECRDHPHLADRLRVIAPRGRRPSSRWWPPAVSRPA
jgi:hypothetical protein